VPAYTAQRARPQKATASSYRNDIDGLRTLAIFLVVIYHVWVGRVSGGVDVFLMISAFLLTGSLTKRAQQSARLGLPRYFIHRFQRLLPAAAVTLVGVLAAAYTLYPPMDWPRIWSETWASLFYYQNWQLAFSSVDYYARDVAASSPLQHFWSLSVQGQVFIIWPVLIALVAVVLKNRRSWIPVALAAIFGTVFVWSLIFSIIETQSSQQFAYFDTRARLWEFAAGSLLALALPHIRLPKIVRTTLGWLGLLGILFCGVLLDVRGGFPGYLALWPILSAAAIIIAGATPNGGLVPRILSSKPLTYFSRDAYALYLVHWPILITWLVISERTEAGFLSGTVVILLSLVLARLLSAGIEAPLRQIVDLGRSTRRGLCVLLASILTVAAVTGWWQGSEEVRASAVMASVDDLDYPGAAQLDSVIPFADPASPLIPLPTELSSEWAAVGGECQGAFAVTETVLEGSCFQSADAGVSDRLIIVIGDSHAQQLSTPLIAVAEHEDLAIITVLKGGCTAGFGEDSRAASGESCEPWARAAINYAIDLNPTAVFTVVTRADANEEERIITGIEDAIDELRL